MAVIRRDLNGMVLLCCQLPKDLLVQCKGLLLPVPCIKLPQLYPIHVLGHLHGVGVLIVYGIRKAEAFAAGAHHSCVRKITADLRRMVLSNASSVRATVHPHRSRHRKAGADRCRASVSGIRKTALINTPFVVGESISVQTYPGEVPVWPVIAVFFLRIRPDASGPPRAASTAFQRTEHGVIQLCTVVSIVVFSAQLVSGKQKHASLCLIGASMGRIIVMVFCFTDISADFLVQPCRISALQPAFQIRFAPVQVSGTVYTIPFLFVFQRSFSHQQGSPGSVQCALIVVARNNKFRCRAVFFQRNNAAKRLF